MQATLNSKVPAESAHPQLWFNGHPSAPGWYTASTDRDPDIRRYWDGSRWSSPVYDDDRAEVLNRAMNTPGDPADAIEFLNPPV